jgi:hypothetical protein
MLSLPGMISRELNGTHFGHDKEIIERASFSIFKRFPVVPFRESPLNEQLGYKVWKKSPVSLLFRAVLFLMKS